MPSPPHLVPRAELCEGGNLMSSLVHRQGYCERDVATIMRQLVIAVQHCHKAGIVHMDLKPENIVLANKWVVPRVEGGGARGCCC